MGSGSAMTDARLAEIKERFRRLIGEIASVRDVEAAFDLVDEVERLRGREESLVNLSRVALDNRERHERALLEIVQAVAMLRYIPLMSELGATTREVCPGCAQSFRRDENGWFTEGSRHAPGCIVEQARALLVSAEADVSGGAI